MTINTSSFIGKDIISISDLSKDEMLYVLNVAKDLEMKSQRMLRDKVVATLFFEPSTRTRLSFESAANKLGARIIGINDVASSSAKKGETLSDTIRMVDAYADVIVLRHGLEGSARRAAEVAKHPVINGGDGANQHPTQTLLDLYAIKKTQGDLENKSVAIVGDLKYGRTAHSLAHALSLFNCELYFIAPEGLEMPKYILDELIARNTNVTILSSFEEILPKLDILYMTRIQKERFIEEHEYNKIKYSFRLEKKHLANVKPSFRILHPLPRVDEIHTNVDTTPYAHYFTQAADGVYVREALLSLLLGGIDK